MTIERDARACYYRVTWARVAKTVEVGDLIMVDVDASDQPIGIEFVMPAAMVTDPMIDQVAVHFPEMDPAWIDDVRRAFLAVRIAAEETL